MRGKKIRSDPSTLTKRSVTSRSRAADFNCPQLHKTLLWPNRCLSEPTTVKTTTAPSHPTAPLHAALLCSSHAGSSNVMMWGSCMTRIGLVWMLASIPLTGHDFSCHCDTPHAYTPTMSPSCATQLFIDSRVRAVLIGSSVPEPRNINPSVWTIQTRPWLYRRVLVRRTCINGTRFASLFRCQRPASR